MLVRIPYLFAAHRFNGRVEEPTFGGDWLEADIPDVSFAPKVCSVEGFTSSGVPYAFDVLKHANSFYRPRLVVELNHYAPLDGGGDVTIARDLGLIVPTRFFRNGTAPDRLDQIVSAADESGTAVFSRTEREAARDVLSQRLQELVFVNGTIWERCEEPMLHILIDETAPVALVGFGSAQTDRDVRTVVFALDQMPMVAAMVEEMSANGIIQVASGRTDEFLPCVSAVDPAQLPRSAGRDYRRSILRTARGALESFLRTVSLDRLHNGFIKAWADCREALDVAEREGNDCSIDAVVTAWDRLENAVREFHWAEGRHPFKTTCIVTRHELESKVDLSERLSSRRILARTLSTGIQTEHPPIRP